MGFFSDRRNQRDEPDPSDDPAAVPEALTGPGLSAQAVTPALTSERIIASLERSGYRYFVDSDGDTGGIWDGRILYFFQFGEKKEILQVRGTWARTAAIDNLSSFLDICNDWNRERIWPKTYVRVRDDGQVVLNTEVSTDLEYGVTDDQLDQLMQCGIATSSMFFNHLDEQFPDPIARA